MICWKDNKDDMKDNKKTIVVGIERLSEVILESLKNGGKVKLTVTGNSMYPLFRHGVDNIILKKAAGIKKYDILLYKRNNGEYVLHRVVKVKDDSLHMAGDYETDIEYLIYKEQVMAVVEGFYRNNRYVSCDNPVYRLYSFIWVGIIPVRHKVIAVLKKIQLFLRTVRRKILE